MTKAAGQRAALGYHDHDVVDGGKARIILHALVTPADVMENAPMLDQLRRVSFRWRLRPARVVADTTYETVENIRAPEDAGIRAYVPLPAGAHRDHPRRASARWGEVRRARPSGTPPSRHLARALPPPRGTSTAARTTSRCADERPARPRGWWSTARRRRSATPVP